MSDPARDRLLATLAESLREGTFAKLTLSEPFASAGDLRNVYGRVVKIQGADRLSLVFHHARRDVTKNLSFEDGAAHVETLLGETMARGYLFTTAGDFEWRPGKLKRSRPRFTVAPPPEHDRKKPSALAADSGFLRALGVTNAAGEPRPGMADKLRQIQRYVELLGHLLEASPLRERRELRVVDMGAGKGYLTFAVDEFFRQRGIEATIVGVEAREDLVVLTNRVAADLGRSGLRFVRGAIGEFPPGPVDLLIALHACDTATDDALFHGLQAGAALLLAAPCCHREVRAQIAPPPVLHEVLRHGILAEREAEIVTDALRALLLEIHGCKTSVFEFVSPEHTSRNLMIAAHRRPRPIDAGPLRQRLRELLDFYGIREQRLARLLGELS